MRCAHRRASPELLVIEAAAQSFQLIYIVCWQSGHAPVLRVKLTVRCSIVARNFITGQAEEFSEALDPFYWSESVTGLKEVLLR